MYDAADIGLDNPGGRGAVPVSYTHLRALAALICTGIASGCTAYLPWVIKDMVDQVLRDKDTSCLLYTSTSWVTRAIPPIITLRPILQNWCTADKPPITARSSTITSVSYTHLKPLLPPPGVLTKRKPTEAELADMEFGFEMAKAIGGLDIGQTVVVKNRAVMAVEAIEGTDACILRGGFLGKGGVIVAKAAKPKQDQRFDIPGFGTTTIESMIYAGADVYKRQGEL